jgi:electron transport complex protein RnfB
MWSGILLMTTLAGAIAAVLWVAGTRLRTQWDPAVEKINATLPQIQCGQCGYPGCRPYAEAIINGQAQIDQCAPGGDATVTALAHLLDRPVVPVNPDFGEPQPPALAFIDEQACIGCALCLKACPVDAILGAPRFMHTVIASECTGCELCIPPCPVDCISLIVTPTPNHLPDTLPASRSVTGTRLT